MTGFTRWISDKFSVFFCKVTLCIAVLFLVSCGGFASPAKSALIGEIPDEPAGQEQDIGTKHTIALVMKTLTNPFFIEMEKGARRAEKELDIRLLVKTAAQETSIEQQIGILEELIEEQVDAIVIAPGDSTSLIPVLKRAQDAGIVIINIDNRLDPRQSEKLGLVGVPFISVDNNQAAYLSAKALTGRVGKPANVIILEGIRSAENAKDRRDGALRAFLEDSEISVVAMETAHWKIDEAYDVTKKLFSIHPDINAVFAANDMMALGAIKFLDETQNTEVLVAGFDALEEARQAIQAQKMVVTIDQQAAQQGYMGIQFAERALAGEDLPAETMIDVLVVTSDTLTQPSNE